jgi:flagellar basal-body rod protein FlgC
MGLYTSIGIATTGLTAERLRSDVIADNIANAATTRTQEGGPYKRSRVILEAKDEGVQWRMPFTNLPMMGKEGGKGVRVLEIQKDTTEGRLTYDPTHPDAIKTGPKAGYVEMPNVNIVTEMVDMIEAQRAYEANSQIINGSKAMFQKALEIGR